MYSNSKKQSIKRLLIMRHAKSSWKKPLPDIERGLKKRGKMAAEKIAAELKKRSIIPDQILASSAVRSIKTAEIISKTLEISPSPIRIEPDLYESSTSKIYNIVCHQSNDIKTLLLVGHNPEISQFAVSLSGEDKFEWLPTAALMAFELPIYSWKELCGKREHYAPSFIIYPKKV